MRVYLSGGKERLRKWDDDLTKADVAFILLSLQQDIEIVRSGHADYIVIPDAASDASMSALKTNGKVKKYSAFLKLMNKKTKTSNLEERKKLREEKQRLKIESQIEKKRSDLECKRLAAELKIAKKALAVEQQKHHKFELSDTETDDDKKVHDGDTTETDEELEAKTKHTTRRKYKKEEDIDKEDLNDIGFKDFRKDQLQIQELLDEIYETALRDFETTEKTDDDFLDFYLFVTHEVSKALKNTKMNPGKKYLLELANDLLVTDEFEYDTSVDEIVAEWVDIIESNDSEALAEHYSKADFHVSPEIEKFYDDAQELARRSPTLASFMPVFRILLARNTPLINKENFNEDEIFFMLERRGFNEKQSSKFLHSLF